MSEINNFEKYILDHIRQAADEGWIKAYFQPVIRTMTEDVSGYEALARWEDPVYGYLTPDVFIPVLEKSGDIYILDLAVLEIICRGYVERQKRGLAVSPVSFNLSRVDLDVPDIHKRISQICDKYGMPHEMIHIEITESTSVHSDDFLAEHIQWFHRDGFQVWMDDFGSGFSTFNTLQTQSFDVIKLDMMFLRKFNDKAEKILKSIVKLAKSLDIGTVCEGVETREEVDFLREIGCERMQGWYYGRPQPNTVLMEQCKEDNKKYECLKEQEYWNEISRVDILTDMPELIVEYDGHEYKVLARNGNMDRALAEIYPPGADAALEKLADPKHYLFNLIDGLLTQVSRTQDTRVVDFIENGNLIMLRATYIASLGERTAIKVMLRNIYSQLEYKRSSLLDEGLAGLYGQFELVNRINPDKDTAMQIYSNASFEKIYGKGSLKAGIAEFTETEVYEKDKERYRSFMNLDTLDERIDEQGTNFLTEAFRLSDMKGGYAWKLVTLLREPAGDDRLYLYEIQKAAHNTLRALQCEYES